MQCRGRVQMLLVPYRSISAAILFDKGSPIVQDDVMIYEVLGSHLGQISCGKTAKAANSGVISLLAPQMRLSSRWCSFWTSMS